MLREIEEREGEGGRVNGVVREEERERDHM